ncbi:L-type lectin-domain containing receptor kinase IX.1-like [Cornus florida]|uniref:L-type lectin-domain containing receptor kinase IX.1-like n=1 Tax=Cornus florida TaxID=4283 RepID=UPI0028990055|nr:L-type lectin-domain containing receptor kinase IX.1-like [Cornus florida]XP_059647957.1 L-type lectin-domain containing receptor kinase IX.1-like [Cornus florida]
MVRLCKYYYSCNDSSLVQLPKKLLYIFFMIITFFLMIFPHATPLEFNIPKITGRDQNVNIKAYPDAYITEQGLQVTPDERGQPQTQKVGRSTYVKPLHLWDKASQNMADFTTHFSFVINSEGDSVNHGDGLAFFLVPNISNSDILVTPGSGLGLPVDNITMNSTTTPFVAVEFDTYMNVAFDPYALDSSHVGIDVKSMRSVNTSIWYGNITHGGENEAWISYSSDSKILSVGFTSYFGNGIVQQGNLSHKVDLRKCLPEWVDFGFSASTGDSYEKHTIKSWSFSSTEPALVTPSPSPGSTKIVPVTPSPSPGSTKTVPVTPSPEPKVKKENKSALVAGLIVGTCVFIGGLGLISISLWKKGSRRKEEDAAFVVNLSMDDEFEKGIGPKKFSYGELAHSTNDFANEEKLGEGGFGGVYRGFLRELASYVAVKRVSRGSEQGLKEYASEVKIISRLRHKNLVQLIGWCHEKNELLLVYEFMPNGSLDSHLFKGQSLLTWAMRYKIVHGLASALLYLHEEWEQCVLHRDIKSSNIMLDSSFNAKLGDFGLARLVDHEKGSQTTLLAGTMGYMAPECVIMGKSSKESDVYSFGIVALEIACGRKSIDLKAQETRARLVEWVWNLYGAGKLLEAADPKLCADFDEQELKCLMIVGLWCAHPDDNLRPSIKQAIHVLNFEAQLPTLPSKMPVPTYFAFDPVNATFPLSFDPTVSKSNQIHYSSYS